MNWQDWVILHRAFHWELCTLADFSFLLITIISRALSQTQTHTHGCVEIICMFVVFWTVVTLMAWHCSSFWLEYSVETKNRVRNSLLSSPPLSLICFCDIDNSTKFLKKRQGRPKSNQCPQRLVSTQARTGGTPAEGGLLQSWWLLQSCWCCWRQEPGLCW